MPARYRRCQVLLRKRKRGYPEQFDKRTFQEVLPFVTASNSDYVLEMVLPWGRQDNADKLCQAKEKLSLATKFKVHQRVAGLVFLFLVQVLVVCSQQSKKALIP